MSTSKEDKVKETGLDDIEESPTPTHSDETPTPTKDIDIPEVNQLTGSATAADRKYPDEPLFVKSSRMVGASTKQKGFKIFQKSLRKNS